MNPCISNQTLFERGPFVATSYDYDAPLDEYGLIRQPKYGHLKELHRAIKMCEQALVSTDPIVTSLGSSQQVLTRFKVFLAICLYLAYL
ncbi:unnamed protein product [Lathyrus sativus]|nr:unnamed protein product [Lathyrus sativus]